MHHFNKVQKPQIISMDAIKALDKIHHPFLYTNKEIWERECKQTIPFKMASKILRNKPYQNYKTLIKEIEDDENKAISCSWVGRINTVKNGHTTQSNLQI